MIALTIAGSDPSGGAGIQADIKTMHQHGVFATSVVTLLTVQNTVGVRAVEILDPEFVVSQLQGVLEDIPPKAAKTGALGSAKMIEAVSECAAAFDFPLVVDPVMVSKHGDQLIDDDAIASLRKSLLPNAFLTTPNIYEASQLTGIEVVDVDSMILAGRRILEFGAANVLVKGGSHITDATDVLVTNDGVEVLAGDFVSSTSTHGSGCVLSAAITARLAMGETIFSSVKASKDFVTTAIRTAKRMGSGVGPLNLHGKVPAINSPC